jgi:hypothetical protein
LVITRSIAFDLPPPDATVSGRKLASTDGSVRQIGTHKPNTDSISQMISRPVTKMKVWTDLRMQAFETLQTVSRITDQ